MRTVSFVWAASSGIGALSVVAVIAGGLIIVGALVWSVVFGMRVRDRELPRPRPEEQPHLPEGGAVREIREIREPDEMPVGTGGRRLMPHEIHHAGSRTGADQVRKRWLPGASGSFGGGGLGHR
ncbi:MULTISPECIES: DUF6479 family protein [unclassified Streptomyces]|uniref:DUF6479 family protein n=1 Tax=unclassified Streptomyces TaxID=2593676 RepID=UPI00381BD2B5